MLDKTQLLGTKKDGIQPSLIVVLWMYVVCSFGGWNPLEETEHICVGAGLNPTPTILFNKHFVYSLINFCTMPLTEPVEVRGFP